MKTNILSFSITVGLALASHGANILFVGANVTANSGSDDEVLTFLEARYGASSITYIRAADATTADGVGRDLIIASSTPGSGDIRSKWQNSTAGVVNWEEAVADNGGGEFSVTSGRPKDGSVVNWTVDITAFESTITAGFTLGQTVTVATGLNNNNQRPWWSTGTQAPGAISYAEQTGTSTNQWLTTVDTGGELLNATTAPGRRVMMGMQDDSFAFFSSDGQKLFGQALDWAGNISPIPEPSTTLLGLLGGLALLRRRRS